MRQPSDAKVLVVDDDEDVTLFLSSVLEDAGFNVETAEDGAIALDKIEQDPPDLISLDLVMPRKSGIRLLRELRRHSEWSRIPVMIVSGHSRDPDVTKSLEDALAESTISGPSAYLDKPVTPRSYLEAVARALDVELDDESESKPDPEALRRQLMDQLKDADAATLQRILSNLDTSD